MAEFKYIHKIKLNDRDDVFLLSNYHPQKKLCITLIDINRCEAFSGNATDIELRSLAASLRMNFSVFISLTTKALTQKKVDDLTFLYSFEQNCEDFVFKWKSIDSEETTLTLGILKMVKNEYASMVNNIFTQLSEELSNLSKKAVDIEGNLRIVEKEKADALHLLSEATNVKENVEKELYGKFVLVLNEKKRKIRDLEQEPNIKVLKKIRPLKSQTTKLTRQNLHEISDSSDEVDNNLDDISAPGPSNLKRDQSFLFDEEPLVLVSPSKIRNRNAAKAIVSENSASNVDIKSGKSSDTDSEDDLLKYM